MKTDNTLNHKGYFAVVNYSSQDEVFFGKIELINDLVTFESDSAKGLKTAFEEAVEDYLEMCIEVGKEPNKAFNGVFNVRVSELLHKTIALEAKVQGVSLNALIKKVLRNTFIDSNTQMDGLQSVD